MGNILSKYRIGRLSSSLHFTWPPFEVALAGRSAGIGRASALTEGLHKGPEFFFHGSGIGIGQGVGHDGAEEFLESLIQSADTSLQSADIDLRITLSQFFVWELLAGAASRQIAFERLKRYVPVMRGVFLP